MNELKRVCLYPKDLVRITGKSERAARKLLNKIKMLLEKGEHQFITISEFSVYSGIDKATIEKYIND